MREYINKYIERKFKEVNKRKPETDKERDTIIKIEGTTKGTTYEEEGIIRKLEDKRINQLLFNRLQRKSVQYKGHLIPLGLVNYQTAKLNGIISEKSQLDFYNTFKDDSIELIKEKISIMQRTIEAIESIKEINDEANNDQYNYIEKYYEELDEIIKHEAERIEELDQYDEYDEIDEKDEYDEVTESRSLESLYYYKIEE